MHFVGVLVFLYLESGRDICFFLISLFILKSDRGSDMTQTSYRELILCLMRFEMRKNSVACMHFFIG